MPADSRLGQELAGLDALELGAGRRHRSAAGRVWSAAWPKAAAAGLVLGAWQAVVWSGWRPDYLVPPPGRVLAELARQVQEASFWVAVATTLRRAVIGYGLALVAGVACGLAVARVPLLRSAAGSLITGLQAMPSIAWFPVAILVFRLSETAIVSVVVLGAAPSIANGVITGVDHVPPLLLRAGRMLGARGPALYRHVVLPAALPAFVGGLKQGWAFAWRSLMAGELLVVVGPSLGARIQFARELSDAELLFALMLVVLVLGVVVDAGLSAADRSLRVRRGLVETAS